MYTYADGHKLVIFEALENGTADGRRQQTPQEMPRRLRPLLTGMFANKGQKQTTHFELPIVLKGYNVIIMGK